MRIYLTIAEALGSFGEFTSEVYPSTSAEEAIEMCNSLIANMIEKMDIDDDIDPTTTFELEGDDWFYRVRWEAHDVGPRVGSTRAYAIDIKWDTDGEEDIDLPTRVKIPIYIDEDEVADFLSNEYGYCVFGFDIKEM